MKERPIIFSAPMVRAILEGRKTMTRRVIKPQPITKEHGDFVSDDHRYGKPVFDWKSCESNYPALVMKCPYGQPGDRLWVRETWGLCDDGLPNDGRPVNVDGVGCLYRATESEAVSTENNEKPCPWRPSIFMPRWASRILLEVTAVRVERVQEITPQDIMAEGVHAGTVNGKPQYTNRYWVENVTTDFRSLWNTINAKRGYGWDANPWVWVIEFRRIDES